MFLRLHVSVDAPDTLQYKGLRAGAPRLDRLRDIPICRGLAQWNTSITFSSWTMTARFESW
jgi:hypothetical protein